MINYGTADEEISSHDVWQNQLDANIKLIYSTDKKSSRKMFLAYAKNGAVHSDGNKIIKINIINNFHGRNKI